MIYLYPDRDREIHKH